MNIIGKWKITEQNVFDKNFNRSWRTSEDLVADPEVEDYIKQSINYIYVFTEEGKMLLLFPIPADAPKEEVEAAIASGEFRLFDDHTMILEEKDWKEEDGKLMFDSGTKGEVLGEKISPWIEIMEIKGGIEFNGYRLAKVD